MYGELKQVYVQLNKTRFDTLMSGGTVVIMVGDAPGLETTEILISLDLSAIRKASAAPSER